MRTKLHLNTFQETKNTFFKNQEFMIKHMLKINTFNHDKKVTIVNGLIFTILRYRNEK